MDADLLITNIGQLVTPAGSGPLRGPSMSEQRVIRDAAIAVRQGIIMWVGPRRDFTASASRELDAMQHAVTPALVDPHTHAIWAGDRLDDFEARASGVGYEEILARGGGIRHTIGATTGIDAKTLADLATPRIAALRKSGAATVEVKSGYGQTVDGELRSLEAIALLSGNTDVRVIATLLLHVPPLDPGDRSAYVDRVCNELIPLVARRHVASAVDVFIEREAFSVDEASRMFSAALTHGLAIKAHADQFHAIGGVELGAEYDALSVDHLEASGDAQIAALAPTDTVAVVLPGVAFHLGGRAAPARELIDRGAIVAIGTDLNPGSSPLYSAQLAMAMAVRINRLTPHEALAAATVNAAAALGLRDCGRIADGQRADILILDTPDWRDLAYVLGDNPVQQTLIAGKESA